MQSNELLQSQALRPGWPVGKRNRRAPRRTLPVLLADFYRCNRTLWRDREGRVSLGVTSLFWGTGMVLKVLLLAWVQTVLGLPLDRAAALQGVFALGVALGAVIAAGQSIAVQNFNESLAILAMTASYALALQARLRLDTVLVLLGMLAALVTVGLRGLAARDR
jgi:hypothetical protein